ncbi:MAG: hypothetical protein LBS58_02025, partial [Coriobacteriales bacterium]|nr:hypothetical protein [Coriobacteriales bacterium]
MAIKKANKKQSTIMKVGTIVICVVLVLGLMVPAGASLLTCAGQQATTGDPTGDPTGSTDANADTADTADTAADGSTANTSAASDLDLAGMYESTLEKYQQAVKDDPSNYTNFERL